MMSDNRVAKTILSAIIGEKIVELDFQPKDSLYNRKWKTDIEDNEKAVDLGIYYLDFNAKIETSTGEYKTVIIELQKKKRETDIIRFRQYLGNMYQSTESTYDEKRVKARQIYCIYLLNYGIGYPDSPVIKVGQQVCDLSTGEGLDGNSEFIKSLNHLQWIVQLEYLKGRRRTEIENLLSIFDQDNITDDNHILNVDEGQFSEEYRPIIRKLQEACASKEVKQQMQAEDLYQTELEIKDQTIEESKKTIEESKKTIEEKDKTIEEKDKSLAEKDREIEELKRLYGIN
jgi:hypothetical protein